MRHGGFFLPAKVGGVRTGVSGSPFAARQLPQGQRKGLAGCRESQNLTRGETPSAPYPNRCGCSRCSGIWRGLRPSPRRRFRTCQTRRCCAARARACGIACSTCARRPTGGCTRKWGRCSCRAGCPKRAHPAGNPFEALRSARRCAYHALDARCAHYRENNV